MKKRFLACLVLAIAFLFLFEAKSINSIYVQANDYNLEMFIPDTYIEQYNLNSPTSLNYIKNELDEDELAIIEQKQNNVYAIFYNENTKVFKEINTNVNLNVDCMTIYKNYFLYLDGSQIWYIDLQDIAKTKINTSISANSFSIYNDRLICVTSNSTDVYMASVSSSSLNFSKIDVLEENEELYFTKNLNEIHKLTSLEDALICKLEININHFVKLEDKFYFTNENGLFLYDTTENIYQNVILTTDSLENLGVLKKPTGITIRDNKIIIADSVLKNIQEYDITLNCFTTFAITSQEQNLFKLSNEAKNLCASENYLFLADNNKIIKINKNDNSVATLNKNFVSSSFTFASSNTHILIFDGTNLSLYNEQDLDTPIFNTAKDVTKLFYIDNEFYYTYNENNKTKISKIVVNETPTSVDISCDELPENCKQLVVDTLSNIYIICEDKSLIKISNGSKEVLSLNEMPKSLQVDLFGNLYLLMDNGKINKFEDFELDNIQEFDLAFDSRFNNYKELCIGNNQNYGYVLSNGCILKTTTNFLNIKSGNVICNENTSSFQLITKTKVFFKPEFKEDYKVLELDFKDIVFVNKIVEYNGNYMSLISDENQKIIGYIPKNYAGNIIENTTYLENDEVVFDDNYLVRRKNVYLSIIIALTITLSAILLEYKLLFKDVIK